MPLILYPDPILKQSCRPIKPEEFNSPWIEGLVAEMTYLLHKYEGYGIAAPQVGEPVQVVVLRLSPTLDWTVINPVVMSEDEFGKQKTLEGCLSLPGVVGSFSDRWMRVRVAGQDPSGELITQTFEGITATVMQHEMDHLMGITLFEKMGRIQRMTKLKKYLRNKKKWKI